jgi:hypothetical protein
VVELLSLICLQYIFTSIINLIRFMIFFSLWL